MALSQIFVWRRVWVSETGLEGDYAAKE